MGKHIKKRNEEENTVKENKTMTERGKETEE